ncbi:MAG: phosphoribosylformylglycinamidine cyclo-ligase [bacterium]|nr:phosphoribosylformylglycinamidine cyclo-ligase [bacterium]
MTSFTYKDAGVDVKAGNLFVSKIKRLVRPTFRPEVLTDIGGFSGLFAPNFTNLNDPILVSSCDGVGTKIKISVLANKHNTIGIDLVGMCVNDVIAMGAQPLFMLDYFATSKLNSRVAEAVVSGIVKGCKIANCALLGGETAEMPGFYQENEYDLAGFCVGILDRSKIINGNSIKPSDQIIGIASSGVHSNGFSFIRKIFPPQELIKFSSSLLTPTKIYVKPILSLIDKYPIMGISHITGGGLIENIQRILPSRVNAEINKNSWKVPKIFSTIWKRGNSSEEEMFKTFNMGIGICIIVNKEDVSSIMEHLSFLGEKAYLIGSITKGRKKVIIK